MKNSNFGSGNAAVVFTIGQILIGHVDLNRGTIFGDREDFDVRIGPANQAIKWNSSQLVASRKAVDTSTHLAFRFHFF